MCDLLRMIQTQNDEARQVLTLAQVSQMKKQLRSLTMIAQCFSGEGGGGGVNS